MQIFLDLMNSPVRRNARGYLGLDDEYLRASVPYVNVFLVQYLFGVLLVVGSGLGT